MYSAGGQCALSGAVHGGLNLEAAAANAHHDEHASGAEHCAVRDERPEAHLGYIHLSEHCPPCRNSVKRKPAKQRLQIFASKGLRSSLSVLASVSQQPAYLRPGG